MKMRKNYTLSLDKGKTEFVKDALKKSNMTLSGFVETSISELYDNLIKMSEVYKKSPAEMTVPEFLSSLSEFMERMTESSEEKEKAIEQKLRG